MRARLADRLSRELSQTVGLSQADFEVLQDLSIAGSQPIRFAELSKSLGWEKSRLSHHLQRMEQRGLLSRDECIADNRSILVTITSVGLETVDRARCVNDAAIRRYVTSVLSEDQICELGAISEAVIEALSEEDPSRV